MDRVTAVLADRLSKTVNEFEVGAFQCCANGCIGQGGQGFHYFGQGGCTDKVAPSQQNDLFLPDSSECCANLFPIPTQVINLLTQRLRIGWACGSVEFVQQSRVARKCACDKFAAEHDGG